MGYFFSNLRNPHFYTARVPLKTAKDVCMMSSVANLAPWTQLKAQTLHHTPTLTLMTPHIRHTDTGQKNHYVEKPVKISPTHHPTGQDNHCNLRNVLQSFSAILKNVFKNDSDLKCFLTVIKCSTENFPHSLNFIVQ